MKPTKLRLIVLTLVFGLLFMLPQSASAAGAFIPAPSRVDMVHDASRNILYITNGNAVLRYDLSTESFLTPFALGGQLAGIDISRDGKLLAVADLQRSSNQVWIHLIDLQTGQSHKVLFTRDFGEGGTYTVAFGNDGTLLITSTYEGSGWVPMRRYSPGDGTSSKIASVRQSTMLNASGDGSVIGFAESNSSDGPWGRYRVADRNLVQRSGYTDGTSWFNYEIGVNRDGTQFALPTYGGTFIYNQSFLKIKTLGQYAGPQPIGVAYHPAKDIVYFAWAETKEVRAFNTTTFTQVATYDVENLFDHTGNGAFTEGRLKLSHDGTLLFVTVDGGIRYLNLAKTDIAIRAQVPRSAIIGQNVMYQVAVTNNGPDPATGVTFKDEISPSVASVKVLANKGECSYANSTVDCAIGDLARGEVVNITITLRPQAAGKYSNVLTVAANETDSNPANSTLTRITKVLGLASFTLSANQVVGGQSLQGTVTLSDTAPYGGMVVTLVDNLSGATVPESVMIPAGKRWAVFDITTQPVTANQRGQITARLGSSRIGKVLTIKTAP